MNPENPTFQRIRIGRMCIRHALPEVGFSRELPLHQVRVALVSSTTGLLLKAEIIDEEGNLHEYYRKGYRQNDGQGGPQCFPNAKVLGACAQEWLDQKKEFGSLSSQKKRIEEFKGLFSLSNYQMVFEQEKLQDEFELVGGPDSFYQSNS